MSARGRGRGRGQAQARAASPAEADDNAAVAIPPNLLSATAAASHSQRNSPGVSSVSSSSRASSAAPPPVASGSAHAGTAASLLRKNDYTKKSAGQTAMKFMPNMPRRKPQVDLSIVKQETDEKPDLSRMSKRPFPAGRGRGKAMMSEMTASGTFAMGPSQGPRKAMHGGGGGAGGGGGGGGGGSGASTSRTKEEDGGPGAYDSSDGDDDWDPTDLSHGTTDKKPQPNSRSANLADIGQEDELAPLVLPRDVGRVLGETEQSILAKDEAQSELPLMSSLPQPRVKAEEPDESEVSAELSRTATATPGPASGMEDEAEEKKKPIVVKAEHVADGFMQQQADSNVEQLYVFQFPRNFPTFTSSRPAPSEPTPMDVDGQKGDIKPDVKPDIKPDIKKKLPAGAYAPGEWLGWGKSAGRRGRDLTECKAEGQIGRLRVHASGKVSLVLGSGKEKMRYDILPAAPAQFLQEVAVQVPQPFKHHDDESIAPGLYVMGQADKKYVVRPNIDQLLSDLDIQRRHEEEMLRVKKEEEVEAQLPKGQATTSDLLAKPKPAVGRGGAAAGRGAAPARRGSVRGRGRGASASGPAPAA